MTHCCDMCPASIVELPIYTYLHTYLTKYVLLLIRPGLWVVARTADVHPDKYSFCIEIYNIISPCHILGMSFG